MYGRKVWMFSLLVCFTVLLGLDIAMNGIREVHGPFPAGAEPTSAANDRLFRPAAQPDDATDTAQRQADGTDNAQRPPDDVWHGGALDPHAPVRYEDVDRSLVDEMANAAGSLLNSTAQAGVELFVGLFDAILN